MSSSLLTFISLGLLYFAYRFYGQYLSSRVFKLDKLDKAKKNLPPAHVLADGVDYVPTSKKLLFGHHFSSIAGAAPIIGPAVAIIWGWGPALAWILFGVIFIGAGHDMGTLVLSMKNRGQSIGKITENILGVHVKTAFLFIIFFLVLMVIAVFTLVIAHLFIQFPSSVLPINIQILVALSLGYYVNKKGGRLLRPTLIAQVFLIGMIFLGTYYPMNLSQLFGSNTIYVWMVLLLIYSFITSILPVWLLLQPRDFINSHQLLLGLALIILGVFITNPPITAPMINLNPIDAPPMIPFLFITIACGAISGFHGLVSSGTTSKQVYKWEDAKLIGYGSMLCEGLLAILATIAIATGFENSSSWHQHYSNWNAANGLSAKIGAFVQGTGGLLSGLGISPELAHTLMAVLIISFAATSLDTAARIQRYIISEIGEGLKLNILKNRTVSGILGIGSAGLLMCVKEGGKGGLALWPLFGQTNQLLAGLSLIVISVYLIKERSKATAYLLGALFILSVTGAALYFSIVNYYQTSQWMLLVIATSLLLLQLWILWIGISKIVKIKLTRKLSLSQETLNSSID